MKVIVTLQHPAHFHFYRNVVSELERRGHDTWIFYRDEELIETLLDRYAMEGTCLAPGNSGTLDAMRNQAVYELGLLRRARRIQPDVMTAIGGIAVAHVASLVGARSVVFDDSGEYAPLNRIGRRFADLVCTPVSEDCEYGTTQQEYPGYHELAYLHPDRFEPDPEALADLGVDVEEPYFVVRFVGWNAQHDIGHAGFDQAARRRLVDELSDLGSVYVTTEEQLPAELREYRLPVPPEMIHDLLYYADLYVGDSQTMATEAALLGTPAVRCNSFVESGDMGNFRELQAEYGLVFSTGDAEEAISQAVQWAADPETDQRWQQRLASLHGDKIDVTAFVVGTLIDQANRDPAGGLAASAIASVLRSGGH